MKKPSKLEAILWSIALPGLGQLLNGHIFKGMLFLILEFTINVMSSFNKGVILSFLGQVNTAAVEINYQWLMFYPCLYMFAMYDAYKFAEGRTPNLSFLPFAFSAYFITVGLIYSSKVKICGNIFGPIWLPIISLIPGLFTGFLIRYILLQYQSK